jgi:hypothetical protein
MSVPYFLKGRPSQVWDLSVQGGGCACGRGQKPSSEAAEAAEGGAWNGKGQPSTGMYVSQLGAGLPPALPAAGLKLSCRMQPATLQHVLDMASGCRSAATV